MKSTVAEKQQVAGEGEKKKGGWGNRLYNFLVYGGWLLVLVLFLAIWVLISVVFK